MSEDARSLLSAWQSPNPGLLAVELDRILSLPAGPDLERWRLLQSIAEQMKAHREDMRPDLWLGLLERLASESQR
ncbi:MAG TPA: hypothetical protein VG456_16890 [Candidatus Sulfopaludibacter sp.]|nr:hypothetical protein [Candidatus Sulfopaludibacter sp.]